MPTEIVTTDDLREFKLDLIKEIKQLFVAHHGQPTKKWLKSYEVRSVSLMLSNKKWLRSSISSKFNLVSALVEYCHKFRQSYFAVLEKSMVADIAHFLPAVLRSCSVFIPLTS